MKTSSWLRKSLMVCIFATFGIIASAQNSNQAVQQENILSPQIHESGNVTFRYAAPQSMTIHIDGDFLPDSLRPLLLTNWNNGVWEYTTSAPLEPELYTYSFKVDGLRQLDPNNIFIFRNGAKLYNIFIVPGEASSHYSIQNVPHGTISKVWYRSAAFNMSRRLTVYTPAGYNTHANSAGNKRYPVLYLLHGMGQDEDEWCTFGRAAQILDNLIAEGKAQPMIVVMPNGNVSQEAAPLENSTGYNVPQRMLPHTVDGLFELRFPEIVEFIDNNYNTVRDKNGRAIAGLSMGGLNTIYISALYPDMFGWVGLFSAAAGIENNSAYTSHTETNATNGTAVKELSARYVYLDLDSKLAAQFEKQPELYWIAIGNEDFLYANNQALMNKLTEAGYPFTYYETTGGHIWQNWRIYLTQFAQLIFKQKEPQSFPANECK